MKKVLDHIDKQTPHKDRLLLALLFAVFAFTVIADVATQTANTLTRLS